MVQGSGVVATTSTDQSQGITVSTDVNGVAAVGFALGARAGDGIHKVRATAVGFDGEILFHANATPNPGDKVSVIAGNNQRGIVRQPLPQPFTVAVTDNGANLVEGAAVEFKVARGGGTFQNGLTSQTVTTDSDGRASVHHILGTLEGLDAHRVTASLVGTVATAGFTASGFMPGDPGQTRISGVVLDNQDKPVPGVTVRVDGSNRQAIANAQGQFTITSVPVGPVHLIADGSTASVPGEWPTLSYNIVTVPGVDNPLAAPIYMVKLDTANAITVGDQDVEYTLPEMPGFKLTVKAGSVTFPDGSKSGQLSVTAVNANKVPMPPPNGMQPQFIVTIQPAGAVFDPPAPLTIPNVDGHLPGAQVEMYSYDHDLEEFVTIGLGTVSKDGSIIDSNTGIGVIKAGWHCGSQPGGSGSAGSGNIFSTYFTILQLIFDKFFGGDDDSGGGDEGGGDEGGDEEGCQDPAACNDSGGDGDTPDDTSDQTNSGPNPPDPNGPTTPDVTDGTGDTNDGENTPEQNPGPDDAGPNQIGDPIIAATGELVHEEIDLAIPGRGFDFELKRTYRSRFNFNGILGNNWEFSYNQHLVVPNANAANQDILRSSGNGRLDTYTKNGDGSYTSPDSFFDVLTKHANDTYTIRDRVGFKINFDADGKMISHVDRAENTMTFFYDVDGRLTTIEDTLGREIDFTYREDSGHIDAVTDFAGRTIRYHYDEFGDLVAVRTPIVDGTPNGNDFIAGKYKTYTYSSGFDETSDPRLAFANHNLLTVTDPKGLLYISNTYGTNPDSYDFDRIVQQRYGRADQVYVFSYEAQNQAAQNVTADLPRSKTTQTDRHSYLYDGWSASDH